MVWVHCRSELNENEAVRLRAGIRAQYDGLVYQVVKHGFFALEMVGVIGNINAVRIDGLGCGHLDPFATYRDRVEFHLLAAVVQVVANALQGVIAELVGTDCTELLNERAHIQGEND